MTSTPDYAAIVVHHGDTLQTIELLHALERDDTVPSVYLIDNGPEPAQHDWSALSRTHVVIAPRNLGYGGGANLGMAMAVDDGHRTVVVAATDAIVQAGDLAELVRRAEASGAAVTGPRIVYEDGRTIWADGIAYSDSWAISRNRHKGQTLAATPAPTAVDYLTGHVLVLAGVDERDWLRFDQRFFMYYEDLDLCRRALDRGEIIRLEPDIVVRHRKRGGASYRFEGTQQFHMSRSAVLYLDRHTQGRSRLQSAVGLAALTLHRASKSRNLTALRAGFRGLRDGLASRTTVTQP